MTTDSDQRPETWKAIPCFSKYEASDLGRVRSVRTGNVLATRVSNSGYLLVKLYDDDARQQTRTVHSLVLLTFAGPRPDGMETLHGLGGPLDNRWPENLRYGTKKENAADQAAAGTARRPATHPCVNHERCGGMVVNQGSRCLPCVAAVGDRAAAMLSAGMSLDAATRRLGYSNAEWVFKRPPATAATPSRSSTPGRRAAAGRSASPLPSATTSAAVTVSGRRRTAARHAP